MARQESDREDLLAEATALVVRAELVVEGFAEPMVIGLRSQGQASVYFGQDRSYHFNSANELRRAYVGQLLYKADRGRLISLRRHRAVGETQLISHQLDGPATDMLLKQLVGLVTGLKTAVASGRFTLLRQVAADGDAMSRISDWLEYSPTQFAIARSPRVGG